MGADIHVFIEYRYRKESLKSRGWESFHEDGKLSLGRDYDLFTALSGVRNFDEDFKELIPPRGLPQDIAGNAVSFFYDRVLEEPDAQPVNAFCEYILRSDVKPEAVVITRRGFEYVLKEDFHSCSYLSLEEIYACLEHAELLLERADIWFQAAVAAMAKLDEYLDVRLVFGFDN